MNLRRLPLGEAGSSVGTRVSAGLLEPGWSRRAAPSSPLLQMAAYKSVFVPDQPHNENVEDGKHDQSGSVRIGETI
jgi:hypothetical protein